MKHARRKPIAERYQTIIACSILVLMIAGTIAFFGYVVPAPTSTASAKAAKQ